jgi:NAD(P)-dependent dehydrogenase (short-subunit alcohol dehydrogenase family)
LICRDDGHWLPAERRDWVLIAVALAAHGASVVVSDRDPHACHRSAEARRTQGYEVVAASADLLVPSQIDLLCETVGDIDVLVCNAGIQGPFGPLSLAGESDWKLVFDVNLCAVARLTSWFIPGMAKRGGGSVILMSSIAGLRGNGAIGLYALSKAALAQLARNLAVDWGPMGVRANSLSPGLIRTPLADDLLAKKDFMARRLQATPLRRWRASRSRRCSRDARQQRWGFHHRAKLGHRWRDHHL